MNIFAIFGHVVSRQQPATRQVVWNGLCALNTIWNPTEMTDFSHFSKTAQSDGAANLADSAQVQIIAPIFNRNVQPGDDLARLILAALSESGLVLQHGDILVLAQKIVSKAENRDVDLKTIIPSPEALRLAAISGKDSRLVEVILSESAGIIRCEPGVIIARHRLGHIMANAGIDHSNIEQDAEENNVLLLPLAPDDSAAKIRTSLHIECEIAPGVMIIDSFGRPWRLGTTGACIGAAGIEVLRDQRGHKDMFGNTLTATVIGIGDEIAAAASMLMGQSSEKRPLVIIRGWQWTGFGTAQDLLRPINEDFFL